MAQTKLVLVSGVGFLLGIFISSFFPGLFGLFLFFSGSLFLICCLIKNNFWQKNKWLYFFILLFLVFGYFYHQLSFDKINKNHISFYQGEEITFQGKVVEYPEKDFQKLKIVLGDITKEGKELKGRVLLNTLPYAGYQFGDILEVKARLTEPGSFKGFDYQSYLAKEDIYSVCYYPLIKVLEKTTNQGFFNALFSLRNRIENLIKQSFTEPQGSFLSAILLGIKDQIPDQVRFWFAQSGIAHVLAISGLHITILAQILLIFFVNVFLISREKAFWPTAIIIILFVLLTGASASSIRAAIMGLGLVWSYRIGRPQAGKRIILYAAVIMLLINPKLLKSDIGFQLSFSAILGISFLYPFFVQWLKKIPFKEYIAVTLSAQIFTLPLVLYYFGNFSLIGVLINVLILPLMPFLMILGLLFAFLGLISLKIAKIVLVPLWGLITGIILIAKIGANIPFLSFIIINFSLLGVIILYFLISLFTILVKKKDDFI